MGQTRGSEWRRWDLHLHTASSYDATYKGDDANKLLCESLRNNNISAAVITDHFMIDADRISALREIAPDIVFFPGVELRTDKGANNLHVILIFAESTNINVLQSDFDAIMIRQKAKAKEKDETIYWDYKDIVDFAKEKNALISIHAGKKDKGIDKEIPNDSLFKEAVKAEIASTVDFFEVGNPSKDVISYKEHVFKEIDEKPLIIGSDCHNPKEYSEKIKEYCWIKADLTFEGLKQCVFQPSERVFIGVMPPAIEREQKNKTGVIDSISVHRIGNPKNTTVNWFDFDIPLNSSMVAVIGNKGSGKSAFSDIIGHLCNCRTMDKASFLNDRRFRKAPKYFAADYEASITWLDGKKTQRLLQSDTSQPIFEEAQYLPQQFIEDVCNDIGSFFQDEINKVIFSYVDKVDRGSASTLEELILQKSKLAEIETESIIQDIGEANKCIILLEKKKTKVYKETIKAALAKKQELLERHETNKPSEVKKPIPKDCDDTYAKKLEDINLKIQQCNETITAEENRIIDINNEISAIEDILAKISRIGTDIELLNSEILIVINKYGLNISKMSELVSPAEELKQIIHTLCEEKKKAKDGIDGNEISTGLKSKLQGLYDEKTALIAGADAEERKYQQYISALNEWETTKNQIIGSATEDDTLSFYQSEWEYIETKLNAEYDKKREDRDALLAKLFELKKRKISVLESIYQPVEQEIGLLLGELEDSIDFQAEIKLIKEDFASTVLDCINLRMGGMFKGKTEAYAEMDRLIKKTEFSDLQSINELISEILQVIDLDIDASDKKVTDRQKLYDYLFGLSYIDVLFKLKMANRSLEELSPGERGIVLLIFYLALNKNNSPIIIDQPEDNLDNQSVFSKLVPCICRAKQRRQVIIVTHNPNIAVACDAEQIVYCEMDKNDYQSIHYQTGAIEDKAMRCHLVDVLEGTMPAFDLRRLKYMDA